MALTINQYPYLSISATQGAQPIGQQIIFSVIDTSSLATYFNIKYIANVYVSNQALTGASPLRGTFKTTPNNAGAGIFDLRPVLEPFLKPDNLGSTLGNGSRYKQTDTTIPIHLIDQCSQSDNSIKYVAIIFTIEGSTTATGTISVIDAINSSQYTFFNGVLQYDNVLENSPTGQLFGYGYNLQKNLLMTSSPLYGQKSFLSNAPTTQYANLEDYGTFAFLNFMPSATNKIAEVEIKYYNSAGGLLNTETRNVDFANGAATILGDSNTQLIYAGLFPGNLRNHSSSMFNGLITAGTIQGGYYTVQAVTELGGVNKIYTIQLNCPSGLGYEPIRLTWLNQWGVWDYYTFTQKSVKSISTNRAPYTQISGTWNETKLSINGYQGGRKNFRVNTSERIKMNTDFVTEAEGVWLEELINSPEVYILNGFDDTEVAPYDTITNKYVEPVTLTTSSYTKKTRANDKLMQYTIEVERSKNRRTQAV
mgnify:CR=1 FL=1|tara:strand:+ start:2683 stop:4119 length:1437 start_codon:yes stop_codon:yes gene_type:complete